MTDFTEDDLELRWLWLASDIHGNIGQFGSSGDGALLSQFMSVEEAETVEEYVMERLSDALGGFCEGIVHMDALRYIDVRGSLPGQSNEEAQQILVTSVAEDASCGLFVYTAHLQPWRPVGYLQTGAPSRPRHVSTLPSQIAAIVERVRFPHLDFASAREIKVEDFDV